MTHREIPHLGQPMVLRFDQQPPRNRKVSIFHTKLEPQKPTRTQRGFIR